MLLRFFLVSKRSKGALNLARQCSYQLVDMKKHRPLGNEENGLELELTFNREVLDCKVLLPVVA